MNEVRGCFPSSPPDSTPSTLLTHTHRHMHKLREWREKRATPPHASSLLLTPLSPFTEKALSSFLNGPHLSEPKLAFCCCGRKLKITTDQSVCFFFFFFLLLLLRNLAAETVLCRHELLYFCQTWWVSRAPVCGVVDDWFREELRKRRRTP